ncbi:YSIRK-type signal peptide-containing protein, partial [Streptococcus mitis]|nr:YSIRK-type signal peptide-containing protein [Streptococcus mitis]
MEHKNSMSRVERLHREKVTRYSIRKYSFGAASVAVAALFMFLGNGAVSAREPEIQGSQVINTTDTQPEKEKSKPIEEVTTPVLNKTQLESYISEIETKLSNGSYDNKTEESVAVLKSDLEAAKATLANATTQAELTKAYNKLVMTVNSGLKNKPTEKKETPSVDTTNGQPTVGKKADNTEPTSGTNSIENTGSKDSRNGQALDKNNAFRAETPETSGNFKYSMEYSNGKKDIYLYNEEEADVNITVSSTAGNITKATVKAGSGQFVLKSKSEQAIAFTKYGRGSMPPEEEVEIDGYGWSYRQTLTETEGPVTIKITGKPNDEFKKIDTYTKTENQEAILGSRFLQLKDSTNAELRGGRGASDPGYFKLIVKSQTYKYDIQQPESNADKIAVSNVDNLTEADIIKIKNELKIKYSDKATTEDARLASKRGEVVNPRSSVVKEIAVANGTVTVTYNDDSVDTAPVSSVARTNQVPTVEIPYSLDNRKDVFVYANEDFDIPVKFTDDLGKIASAEILRGGNKVQPAKDESNPNILDNEYDTVVEKISTETPATAENPAVVHIRGKITKDTEGGTPVKKITLPTTESAELPIVTRYATATDTDGGLLYNTATGNSYASDPGSFRIVLKAQTAKYDIKNPETKISVDDANNISEDVFNQIKDSIKIQYSTTNKDKNLLDKQGTDVDNQTERIESIEREGNNVVVTYKDGSKDTKALADFVNVAPKVALPYSNEANKQIYVYTGENTDLTFKGTDEKEIKDLYLRGPGDISGNNAAGYGLPTGKVENGEVTGEGSVSEDKTSATIKMTGKTNLPAGQQWTSFIVSKDNDGKLSNTDYRALDKDPNARQKPGYAHFLVKNQTFKYDIATPTEKVAVTDPANVTQDELDKIKEKLQIEYSKSNDDANLAEKKGKAVDAEDAKTKIKSVEKDNAGNLVVTYTDGSKDTRPLSDFVAKNPEVTPVKDPANLTDAEKTKVEEAVKKANPTATKVEVGNDGTTTVTLPDGSTAKLTPEKTAKTADSNGLVDPEVTPVKDPANLTDAEKTKVEEAVKKANPTATKVEVGNDGTTTVTFPDGSTAKLTPEKTAKTADSNGLVDPEVTPVKDPANLTDAEKTKVEEAVKKANPTATKVEVGNDGTTTVTLPDGSTAKLTPEKTAKTADSNGLVDPEVTPVKDPANLTDAEKTKVEEAVKKANPTATKVEVGNDGTTTVTFPDGSTAKLTPEKTAKTADSNGLVDPEVTPVKDPANLTDAEKTKVEEAVKKANPTATKVEVGNDGTTTVT